MDSGRPREAQVQSYPPGGANVTTWEGTLAPHGEYDRTVCQRRRCDLMSDYFDHLLLLAVLPLIDFNTITPLLMYMSYRFGSEVIDATFERGCVAR